MDPLFERREMVKKVRIDSKFMQEKMDASILAQLKMNYEGMCSAEGFIERNSITLVEYSLGRANFIRGGIDYDVKFQADVCYPHPGQHLKARVTVRSKVGIHAETPPIKVLIPRDLYIGNEQYAEVKEGEDIEFEVVGSQFKQKDTEIIVVGKLIGVSEEPKEEVKEEKKEEEIIAPAVEGEKKVTIVSQTEPEKKKRKLKKGAGEEVTFSTLPPPPE